MIIGLMGFPFRDGNKGCEALTYSFVKLLNDIVPENLVIYRLDQNDSEEQISQYFKSIDFEFKKIKIKDYKGETTKNFKECDFIFDVTFGDNFSDIYSLKFVFKTTLFKYMVIHAKTPLILAPQTLGPFKNKLMEKFASYTMINSYRIFARDQRSADYAMKLAKQPISVVTDLAFALPYKKLIISTNNTKLKFGLNISGLLWRGGFSQNNQFKLKVNYHDYISKIIERLLQSKQYEIYLIPHVIADDFSSVDDDYKECNIVKKLYPELKLAPAFQTPIEAKNYIAAMDIFIGARMHSTIAAFSSGVPVIPFSYSRKFEGLYDNLGYSYVIHGCEYDTDTAIEKTFQYIEQRNLLKDAVSNSMKQIDNLIDQFKQEISRILLIYNN